MEEIISVLLGIGALETLHVSRIVTGSGGYGSRFGWAMSLMPAVQEVRLRTVGPCQLCLV